jgi:hypothetical protein
MLSISTYRSLGFPGNHDLVMPILVGAFLLPLWWLIGRSAERSEDSNPATSRKPARILGIALWGVLFAYATLTLGYLWYGMLTFEAQPFALIRPVTAIGVMGWALSMIVLSWRRAREGVKALRTNRGAVSRL